jgi:hypothetical protein
LSLNNINAIENIESSTITDLHILGNSNLSTCHIESICNYLANPNGEFLIQGNAIGCNNQEEVQEACEVGVVESVVDSKLASVNIFPNPSSSILFIELQEEITRFQLSLIDLNGHELIKQEVTQLRTTIDVNKLAAGIYFARFTNENEVRMFKVVKY